MLLYYKEGYKHQTSRTFRTKVGITGYDIETDYCRLTPDGFLEVFPKYAWDGASCFPDFSWIMRGAFVHDVGYQLIREMHLPRETKEPWDRELEKFCILDRGVIPESIMKVIAAGVFKAVHVFGMKASHPNNRKHELVAP